MTNHPGISMHKLPVGGNIAGGLFTIGVVLMVLVGVPLAPWFLLGATVLGAILSIFVMRWHQRHKIEIDDLSALSEPTNRT